MLKFQNFIRIVLIFTFLYFPFQSAISQTNLKPVKISALLNAKRLQEKDEWDNPRDRESFRLKQRLDDLGQYDVKALIEAKKYNDHFAQLKTAGILTWTWLGPGNIGGRTRTILLHPTNPNIIWVGSVSGGIWKTLDGGSTWTPMSDFISSLAITSLIMDPANPNIIYASTGEGFGNIDALPGAGVFKSTDGGQTWNLLASTSTWKYCNRLAIHPTQSNILFAAVYDPTKSALGQIYKSTDYGVTWTSALIVSNNAMKTVDIKISTSNPNLLMVGCYIGTYLSIDGGTTWRWLATGNAGDLPLGNPSLGNVGRCEVAFAPSNSNILYISMDRNNGEIWKSTNAGTTWFCANTGNKLLTYQGWFANTIAVSPSDPNLVVVGGLDIYRSSDGGTTITKISDWTNDFNSGHTSPHADHHVLVFSPGYNGTTNKKMYNGSDGGICLTNDITTVTQLTGWISLNNGLGITQFYGGAAAPDGSVIIGGTQDNANLIYKPADGINGWKLWASGDGGFCAINPRNTQILYCEAQYLAFGKSSNGGMSTNGFTNGLLDACNSNKTLFVAPFVIDNYNPNRLIAGGTSIWRTTNGALNWSSIRSTTTNTPKCSAIAISIADSNVTWVGYDNGEVAKTTNAIAAIPTWTILTLPAKRYITDIAIAPDNSNKVIVTMGGNVTTHIYCTTDGGATWTSINGNLPAIQINTVTINPSNTNWVYIGTDLGIYSTETLGTSWILSGQSENMLNVEVDELFWQGSNLVAATHGRGMYLCLFSSYIYVNFDKVVNGNGTLDNEYNNIRDAVNNSVNGSTIVVKGTNTKNEAPPDILMNKRLNFIINNGPVIIK